MPNGFSSQLINKACDWLVGAELSDHCLHPPMALTNYGPHRHLLQYMYTLTRPLTYIRREDSIVCAITARKGRRTTPRRLTTLSTLSGNEAFLRHPICLFSSLLPAPLLSSRSILNARVLPCALSVVRDVSRLPSRSPEGGTHVVIGKLSTAVPSGNGFSGGPCRPAVYRPRGRSFDRGFAKDPLIERLIACSNGRSHCSGLFQQRHLLVRSAMSFRAESQACVTDDGTNMTVCPQDVPPPAPAVHNSELRP